MKSLKYAFFVLLLMTFIACGQEHPTTEAVSDVTDQREFYQLKTYTFDTEAQQTAADAYFKNAVLPALKRMEMTPIGVFKNRPDEKDSALKTLLLIPFSSMDQFMNYEAKLAADAAHQEAGKAFLQAPHDQPAYRRVGSVLMQAFVDMPSMQASGVSGPRSERVYELRSYESSSEAYYHKKVDMFNAGGEIPLFERLNFQAVFYGEVLSGPSMPNLMYMTTFPNMAVRDSLWKEFFASPEWTELKAMEKYKNSVSHVDIFLLYPTEYSD